MRENQLIQKIDSVADYRAFLSHGGVFGIGDDAALWKPRSGKEAILTCDWFLEGTHFLRDKHPPDAVGWKCLARAVSDIAAMGGAPVCFLLSLALPAKLAGRWLDEFLAGLRRAAREFGCPLVGGDTTSKNLVTINVTVVGEIPYKTAVLRSGARPGDLLFVSGRLGEADLGLHLIRDVRKRVGPKNPLLTKHLYPEPRLALGRWLAEGRLASAMMDLSDGLSADLPRLCAASEVGARIDAGKIPKPFVSSFPAKRHMDLLKLALHGGDDYELLFVVPPAKAHRIPRSYKRVPLTPIGEITKRRTLVLVDERGRERKLANRGWDPFRRSR